MGATAVQDNRAKYEKTTDPKRMINHALLNEAIRTDWDAIKTFLPARTATSMRYDKGAKTAHAWNEGGKETKIDLPLNDGWYVPDGNPFAIPNGKSSNRDDPNALYLYRHQNQSFSGPLGRGYGFGGRRRDVIADVYWSYDSGVALVGGRGATAPLVKVPEGRLVEITDPETLREIANKLSKAAVDLRRSGDSESVRDDAINVMAEAASRFAQLSEAINGIKK